jgi:hypothetical protein
MYVYRFVLYHFVNVPFCNMYRFSTKNNFVTVLFCNAVPFVTYRFVMYRCVTHRFVMYRYCSRHGFLHQRMNANGSDTK